MLNSVCCYTVSGLGTCLSKESNWLQIQNGGHQSDKSASAPDYEAMKETRTCLSEKTKEMLGSGDVYKDENSWTILETSKRNPVK